MAVLTVEIVGYVPNPDYVDPPDPAVQPPIPLQIPGPLEGCEVYITGLDAPYADGPFGVTDADGKIVQQVPAVLDRYVTFRWEHPQTTGSIGPVLVKPGMVLSNEA